MCQKMLILNIEMIKGLDKCWIEMTEGTKQKNFVIGCIYTHPKIVSVSIKPLNLCGNVQ